MQKLSANEKIDGLLQKRQQGFFDYVESTKALLEMGVKFGNHKTNEISVPPNFNKYLAHFSRSNAEFEWLVEYKDGTKLAQFEGDNQHNFKHIDKSQIKTISYISNFDWSSDMADKRVTVRLNWETGLFEFLNGFASQEVRAECCMNPIPGEKKLILIQRKSIGSSAGLIADEQAADLLNEYYRYNRFIIGYEVAGKKKAVIIDPTGVIDIFEK